MSIVNALKSLSNKVAAATRAVVDDIGAVRKQIDGKRWELEHATQAPLPPAEVKAERIPALVAERGAAWLREHGPALLAAGTYAHRALASPGADGYIELPNLSDWFGITCAADPARATALLSALIDRVGYEPGPASQDRPALITRLSRELADLEAAEEAAVDQAAAAGVKIEHRADVRQRREREARQRELDARRLADQSARQAALDARHQQERGRGGRSRYIESRGDVHP